MLDDALYDDLDEEEQAHAGEGDRGVVNQGPVVHNGIVNDMGEEEEEEAEGFEDRFVDEDNTTLVNVVNQVLVGPEVNPLPMLRPDAQIQPVPPVAEHHQGETAGGEQVEEEELCQCCYNDVQPTYLLSCPIDQSHKVCTTCLTAYASNQLGLLRHQLRCLCVNDDKKQCESIYPLHTLTTIPTDKKIIQKLLDLEQAACIADAEIEGLEKCVFCGYMEIYPPINDTADEKGEKEFRCMHPDCGKVMCRTCRAGAHPPTLSCDVVKKMGRLGDVTRARSKSLSRRYIEESMTEALVRKCPNQKCGVEIIKDDGCNCMTCSRCGSKLCYLCGKDITQENYGHFGAATGCETHRVRDEQADVEQGKIKGLQEAETFVKYVEKI